MEKTRRDFLGTGTSIGVLGLLSTTAVGSVSGSANSAEDLTLSSELEKAFEIDEMSMSDDEVHIDCIQTSEELDGDAFEMEGLQVGMSDGDVEQFEVNELDIPPAVEADTLELGQQILDGEDPTPPDVPSIVIDFIFPNLFRERIASIPFDFFDADSSIGGLIMDILDILDAFGGLRAVINLLSGILRIFRSPGGIFGGIFSLPFVLLNFISEFFS